jgi:pimeloyl-ACP methyl ester carboxylesterase
MQPAVLSNRRGQKLAYVKTPPQETAKAMPWVVFLGGFKSDMTGTKAIFLEQHCRARGIGFVRFDYTGHGASEGRFEDGTISQWTEDAQDILDNIVDGDAVLVGSSMGGWIALNLLLRNPERIRGVVGIAAAPDFTQGIEPRMTPEQLQEFYQKGKISAPSAYGEPYVYTRALIEDGRKNLLLDRQHNITVPLLLLQGMLDDAVPWETALRIRKKFHGPMTDVIIIEDGDHRLSRPQDLESLAATLGRIV